MYHPQIETLIHVADTGSFSKATDKIYLTAVSVMNQINDLEKKSGRKTNRSRPVHLSGCKEDHRRL